MEVILLQDVKSLGKKGDLVKVNEGYARNFILPKKLGVEATNKNRNDLKLKQANDAKVAQEKLDEAKRIAKLLEDGDVQVTIKGGNGGRSFGSVSNKEIAEAIKEQKNLEIDKKKIVLASQIKSAGRFEVTVKLHKDVSAKLAVKVIEV